MDQKKFFKDMIKLYTLFLNTLRYLYLLKLVKSNYPEVR